MDGPADEVGEATREPVPTRLRALPQVQRLLETSEARRLVETHSRSQTVEALRTVLEDCRAAMRLGDVPPPAAADLLARAGALMAAAEAPRLGRVINATGVVLHTNLGRAPLAREAVEAAAEAARSYVNLEFDLERGERGSRTQGVERLLRELTGAPAALAVNNAAAAVLLALSALAGGGEVIVSRGELVEIGGGFRIPDVIVQGGARLVEVGTTNRTRLSDYRDAITPHTRMLLKVHPSNYRVVGFTGEASLAELAGLAAESGLALMQDLGGGALVDLARLGRPREPTVQDALAAGADLVAFSGDKLMGGPQSGLLVGSAAAVDPLRRHPLLRAVRLDKMSLAALEATLRLYRDPETATDRVPVLAMLAQGEAVLQARALALGSGLDGTQVERRIETSQAYAGGGALPQSAIASRALTLSVPTWGPDVLARRLRAHRPAVLARVADGRVVLDMMAVSDEELPELASAIRDAIA